MNRLGKGLLFLFLSGLVLFPLLEGAEPAGALEDLQEINERIEETKDELTRTQKEERSVLSLLTRAQRELVQIETELAGIEERLRRTDAAISGLQRQLTALEKEIIGLKGSTRTGRNFSMPGWSRSINTAPWTMWNSSFPPRTLLIWSVNMRRSFFPP